MSLTLEDIRAAGAALRGNILESPCLFSRTLSEITGAQVYLKFENHQFTASFKERGALVKLLSLDPEQRARGVIAASAGNHAQGVAYHARRLGIPAVIVMPRYTPAVKVEQTRSFGAEVVLEGRFFDEAWAHAALLAQSRELTVVHPYDDLKVMAGQGTIALEMLSAWPDLDALLVPVGGGGLLSGMAVAARAVKPGIELFGVQTRRFPSTYAALRGEVPEFGTTTIADGIAVKLPGKLTLPVVRELVREVLLVDEGDIEEAIVLLLEVEKTVVEGAGAVGLAALLRNRERFAGRNVGLLLCGGNIDPLMLAEIIERGMVRTGRLARLQVELSDLPGSLSLVTACLAQASANIQEVHHQRAFAHVPVKSVEVDFVLETRSHAHVQAIIEALARAGFQARLHND